MAATFISDDGEFKLEAIETQDHGKFITVWQWASESFEWIHVIDIRWPVNWKFDRVVELVAGQLIKYIADKAMVECDDPDWEDEAMEMKPNV